jgi:hypothetical protein
MRIFTAKVGMSVTEVRIEREPKRRIFTAKVAKSAKKKESGGSSIR